MQTFGGRMNEMFVNLRLRPNACQKNGEESKNYVPSFEGRLVP